jgi:hypothetical protein
VSLREIASGMVKIFQEKDIFPPAMGELEKRNKIWTYLYQEYLTDEKRISLEGVGLIKWFLKWPDNFHIPEELFQPPWLLNEEEAKELIFILLDFLRTDKAVDLVVREGVTISWSDLNLQANQKSVVYIELGNLKKGQRQRLRRWNGLQGRRAQYLIKLLKARGFTEDQARKETATILAVLWDAIRGIRNDDAPTICTQNNDGYRLNPDWWRAVAYKPDDFVYICDTCGRLQTVSVASVCTRHQCPGRVSMIKIKDLPTNHYNQLYQSSLPGLLRVEEHTAQINHEKSRQFQREFKSGKIHVLSCSTTFELGVDLGDLNIVFLRNVPPESFNYTQRVGRTGRRTGIPGFALTYCRKSSHDFYHFNNPYRMLRGTIKAPMLYIGNDKIITRHVAATMFSSYFREHPHRFGKVEDCIGDFNNPTAVADFRAHLLAKREQHEAILKKIIPKEMWERIGLNGQLWIERISGEDSRLYLAELEIASDYRSVTKLEKSAVERKQYRKAEWARKRQDTIRQESTLNFLSRKAIIPKYGFPVDVVELDTQRNQQTIESQQVSLQRDLSLAISEFAPSSKIVANKKEWLSYAVKRVPEREWERWYYCLEHNTFIKKEKREENEQERCCSHMREFIIPRFGFVTNQERAQEPKGRPSRLFSSRPYFVGLKGTEPEKVDYGVVVVSRAARGQMVVICEGRKGAPFYICTTCGAGFSSRQQTHNTPFGETCSGRLDPVSLGHEFITDVLGLRFTLPTTNVTMDHYWFAYSLGTALAEGTSEELEFPSTDLNVTVVKDPFYDSYQIVLYDAVPGGAGLVGRLEEKEVLYKVIKNAYDRVRGECGCSEEASCYSCLRSYRNQFAHPKMQRGPVKQYLFAVLDSWN